VREREEYLAEKRAEEAEAEAAEDAARRKYNTAAGGASVSGGDKSAEISEDDFSRTSSDSNSNMLNEESATESDTPPLHSFGKDAEL
jgi:hypothetical protein